MMTTIRIFKRGWWPDHPWHPFKSMHKCPTVATIQHEDRRVAMQRARELCEEKTMKLTPKEKEAGVKHEWCFI